MLKRIKRLWRKRTNAGFTLVEVIISVALLGIMILGVLGFMAPVMASIAENQQNARAVMLMEAVDSYVTNSVRYADYLKIYTNVKVGTDPTVGDSEFDEMKGKIDASHELRCFSFSWKETGVQKEFKLVLRQHNVDQSTGKIKMLPSGEPDAIDVMGDCVYEGLNIIPEFELVDNSYEEVDAAGNTVQKNPPGSPEWHYVGFKNTTKVYNDKWCYSTSEANRNVSTLAYVGRSTTSCTKIASNFTNPCESIGYKFKIYEISEGTYDATGVSPSKIWQDDKGSNYYYPETYVYYIVRKLDAAP